MDTEHFIFGKLLKPASKLKLSNADIRTDGALGQDVDRICAVEFSKLAGIVDSGKLWVLEMVDLNCSPSTERFYFLTRPTVSEALEAIPKDGYYAIEKALIREYLKRFGNEFQPEMQRITVNHQGRYSSLYTDKTMEVSLKQIPVSLT